MSASPSSLCPGYVQVEQFGDDDDYEDEVDVSYVTLDLGSVEPTLVPSSSSYRLIGLDTPTPFLQLSGSVFRGRHDHLLGTELLFTDATSNQDRTKRGVTHIANTEQRIQFREVYLNPKDEQVAGEPKPLPKRVPLGIETEEPNTEEKVRRSRRSRGGKAQKKGKQKQKDVDAEDTPEESGSEYAGSE